MYFKKLQQEKQKSSGLFGCWRLELGTKDGDHDYGKVETNMQFLGHPHHRLTWQIQGLVLKGITGERIRTENRTDIAVAYEGLILGDVIAGEYRGKDNHGKPVQGTFRIEAQKP